MKIYDKKKFISSLFWMVLLIVILISLITKGFNLKKAILLVISFPIYLSDLRKSFSKVALAKEKIEEMDERNQLVDQLSKAVSFTVIRFFVMGLQFLFLILFGLYKNETLLLIVVVLGLIVFVTFISELISGIYYERKL